MPTHAPRRQDRSVAKGPRPAHAVGATTVRRAGLVGTPPVASPHAPRTGNTVPSPRATRCGRSTARPDTPAPTRPRRPGRDTADAQSHARSCGLRHSAVAPQRPSRRDPWANTAPATRPRATDHSVSASTPPAHPRAIRHPAPPTPARACRGARGGSGAARARGSRARSPAES